ncbi:ComF family protein [Patescibacteria group bacterium]
MVIHNTYNWMLDLIMPMRCAGCGTFNKILCKNCIQSINQSQEQYPFSGITSNIENIWWYASYNNSTTRNIVHQFKYKKMLALVPIIAQLMKNLIPINETNCLLVPIPLNIKKEKNRGFNQAELLANEIAKYADLQILPKNVLIRKEGQIPQAKIKERDKRIKNIKGAFLLMRELSENERNIILIDDVATSGATLSEAAYVLKQGGAKKISAAVFAHG